MQKYQRRKINLFIFHVCLDKSDYTIPQPHTTYLYVGVSTRLSFLLNNKEKKESGVQILHIFQQDIDH